MVIKGPTGNEIEATQSSNNEDTSLTNPPEENANVQPTQKINVE